MSFIPTGQSLAILKLIQYGRMQFWMSECWQVLLHIYLFGNSLCLKHLARLNGNRQIHSHFHIFLSVTHYPFHFIAHFINAENKNWDFFLRQWTRYCGIPDELLTQLCFFYWKGWKLHAVLRLWQPPCCLLCFMFDILSVIIWKTSKIIKNIVKSHYYYI